MMIGQNDRVIDLPFASAPLRLTLRPEVGHLRDAALQLQHSGVHGIPTLPLIDAASWAEHTPDEDWLVWRARRTAARLNKIPLSLSSGERVVGRPDLRPPTPAEARAIEAAQQTRRTIPPYPGGDAGHFHPDFAKLFRVGIGGIRAEIRERDKEALTAEQHIFYRACDLALQGLSGYAQRVADACEQAAEKAPDGVPWRNLARICCKKLS